MMEQRRSRTRVHKMEEILILLQQAVYLKIACLLEKPAWLRVAGGRRSEYDDPCVAFAACARLGAVLLSRSGRSCPGADLSEQADQAGAALCAGRHHRLCRAP